jgi:hypothetical protein
MFQAQPFGVNEWLDGAPKGITAFRGVACQPHLETRGRVQKGPGVAVNNLMTTLFRNIGWRSAMRRLKSIHVSRLRATGRGQLSGDYPGSPRLAIRHHRNDSAPARCND